MRGAQPRARRSEDKARKKLRFTKKIYDNVHGYIDLTENERLLIDSYLFQRLRRIAHLGLADFVYPGATHSRFSHSIGSMFVMTKIAVPLIEQGVLDYEDLEVLRIAALFHDVGHYPFSHVIEGTMKRLNKEEASHESLGVFLLHNTSLEKNIRKVCDPEKIGAILKGNFRDPPLFQYLTSSSLDVDKIDYLQRDSVHTGVAYGAFDVDRLLSCFRPDRTDKPTKLIVTRKGRQAIEDFLLSRFHMFQSVYHHKSVVAFELMLDRIVESLIRNQSLPDLGKIKSRTEKDEQWFGEFDDAHVWQVLKSKKRGGSVTNELIRRLFSRDSLKMADERLTLSDSAPPQLMERLTNAKLPSWLSEQSGVDKNWIFYKQQPRVTFLEPDLEVTVYIETSDDSEPIPIMQDPTSIIKKLWESKFWAYRIYTRDDYAREKIENTLRRILGQ